MLTYLFVNLATVAIPFAFSFDRRLLFFRTWIAFWPAVLITAAIFIAWDVYYTRLGVWGFNDEYVLGVDLLGVPFEEWLFFICIPYACVFTYHCLNKLVYANYLDRQAGWITGMLIGALSLVGALNLDKNYTSVTFIATAVFLLLHLFVFKSSYLGRFYFSYIFLLLPFLLVNGLLTGSFIADEVVWYNETEFMGLRFLTIPVEDFIYAMLLILMNITIYEAILSIIGNHSRPAAMALSSER